MNKRGGVYIKKEYIRTYDTKRGDCVSKEVEVFKNNISEGKFKSISELERRSLAEFGVKFNSSNISAVASGRKEDYKGYVFKYINIKPNKYGIEKTENIWVLKDDYIELTVRSKAHGEFVCKLDIDDYDDCNSLSWNIMHPGGKYSYKYYAYAIVNSKSVLLHRYLMNPKDRYEIVDHINGDELDNRRCNLRICTNIDNTRNVVKRANNTSGYKGVTFYKTTNKWMAYIKYDGKIKNLGYFVNLEDAVNARVRAESIHFGEYANLDTYRKIE